MAGEVTVLGIRHHGPGSARMVVHALKKLAPDAVLIEGPPDAAAVLALAGHTEMVPPVALVVYEPDQPRESAYYPFAEFSPEWRAIRWALENKTEVRFIDLPRALRPKREEPDAGGNASDGGSEAGAPEGKSEAERRRDPLEALAIAAGFSDGEAWWGRLIEERRGDEDPIGVFDAIRGAMGSARKELGPTPHDPDEPAREAHMRRSIRAALKEGFESIAVVCGAWHAPVLTAEALEEIAIKDDDAALKSLTKHKTAATWIPWTYERLSAFSGYGAGVMSPGWYDHLWVHHEKLSEHWLTKVARLMRDEGMDASPASVIESVRLADSLAALRGRAIAGLEELGEATLSILCHGNPLPMGVIARKLIVGDRLGEVPAEVPTVPLQRDLAALQKSLRLKVSADDIVLDLDQRKEMDLARSRLLHRLTILNISWGGLEDNQMRRTSTFHEIWKLQWKPEFAVAVIEAARWGNTVEEAAAAFVADRAGAAAMLGDLTAMLDHAMLADLPTAVERLVARIQELSAVSADLGNLMEALPPLARVLRYGNVRKTDAALVEPVVTGLLARTCVGLLPACGSLDDEAAEIMRGRIDGVEAALATLERADLLGPWREALRRISDAKVHGLLAGRCTRILLDSGNTSHEDAATLMSLALSAGNDPGPAASWLEGFLGGSGLLLVHDPRLLSMIDGWVCGLTRELFERACPIVRRTFSEFSKTDRRMIGEKLRDLDGSVVSAITAAAGDDYDAERGDLVLPVLRMILGEST